MVTQAMQPNVAYYALTESQLKYFVQEAVKTTLQEFGVNYDEVKAHFTPDLSREYKPLNYWLKEMNVNRSTIWRWQQQGLITPHYIGKKVYFCQADFDKALRKNKQQKCADRRNDQRTRKDVANVRKIREVAK